MVVQELVPNLLALGQLRQVLQNLVKEQVPIKDLSMSRCLTEVVGMAETGVAWRMNPDTHVSFTNSRIWPMIDM